MREQAVDAGHAHVVQPHHVVAQHLGRDGGLLGHRQIARAGGGYHDRPLAVGLGRLAQDAETRALAVSERERARAFQGAFDRGGLFGVEPGDQHALLPVLHERAAHARYLLGRLARTVHHLRHALAHAAMVVHRRVAQLRERGDAQRLLGLVDGGLARRDALEQLAQLSLLHVQPPS